MNQYFLLLLKMESYILIDELSYCAMTKETESYSSIIYFYTWLHSPFLPLKIRQSLLIVFFSITLNLSEQDTV